MICYHTSNNKDWCVDPKKKSRYDIPALFFSTDIQHAEMYQSHIYSQHGEAYIHEVELNLDEFIKVKDFQGKSSYTPNFKKMIHRLYKLGVKGAVIKDVVDVPSKVFDIIKTTDIVVVFRF